MHRAAARISRFVCHSGPGLFRDHGAGLDPTPGMTFRARAVVKITQTLRSVSIGRTGIVASLFRFGRCSIHGTRLGGRGVGSAADR
jgi:hypothetical protein